MIIFTSLNIFRTMITIDLLSEVIPAVNKTDTGTNALNWMEVFKVSHLPIVHEQKYLGLISESDIYDMNSPELTVIDHCLSLTRPFVKDNQNIYDIIDLVSKLKLSIIPVLDSNENYLGLIRVIDLAQEFSRILSTENPGGVIVLELKHYDYSFSEIAQIVESNDIKILSTFVNTKKNSDKLEITLKLNKTDLSAVIQTFERYNYSIQAIHASHQEIDSMMQNRIDSFFKYLDI